MLALAVALTIAMFTVADALLLRPVPFEHHSWLARVANDAGIVWVKGVPIALVVFTGHHRGSTSEMHDAVARIAAAVVHHYGGDVDPAGLK